MNEKAETEDGGSKIYKVREVVALFDDSTTMERAVDALREGGFDRTDISLLATEKTVEKRLGHRFKRVEEVEDDGRVPRQAFTSISDITEGEVALIGTLLYIGAAAGTVAVVASGGTFALVLAAAAAGGVGGATLGGLAAMVLGESHANHLEEQLAKGGIVLWVRLRDPSSEKAAADILSKAGGRDIHAHDIERTWGTEDIPLHDFNPDPLLKNGQRGQNKPQ